MRRVLPFLLPLFVIGCFRGTPSDQPPLHVIFNMDDQPKLKPYGKSTFFQDGSAMRMPVDGTVARGDLRDDVRFFTGKDEKGTLIASNPLPLTAELLHRGQERFNIYCRPCHGAIGDGKGAVAKRGIPLGLVPPANFHAPGMKDKPDGHYFDVITNGIRNMVSYRHQIEPRDRWAIVSYVRALQRSQDALASDVPESMQGAIK